MSSKQGWATKQGGRIQTWRRRWFVLKGQHLHYYKNPSDTQAAGSIELAGCTVAPANVGGGKANGFQISGSVVRTFNIHCDTADERDEWCQAITQAISGAAKGAEEAVGDTFDLGAVKSQKVGLDDFDLLKVVGRGAFGKVMLVRKKDSGALYAMKILAKDMLIKRNQVARTKAESRILRAVEHPFVVGLKFGFQTDTKLYLVLDYVNGGDLFVHLQHRRRFTAEQARLYTAEMVLAFEHLHELGIAYRDLKPENILMGCDGHICLTDFGLSKEHMTAADTTNSFCGTPEYLAPEILQTGQGYTKDVDWWSLGILIYEMMVGKPPFYSDNVNDMYEKILQDELTFPPGVNVPEDAKDLIRKLLIRTPEKRLGYGAADASVIKPHPFFGSIDWNALMKKEVPPPFKPDIKGETDVSNFDPIFTQEAAVLTVVDTHLDAKAQQQFSGFTYVGDSTLADHG